MTDKQETARSVPQTGACDTDENGNGNVGIGDGGKTTQCTSALNIDLIWAAVERRVYD